MNADMWQPKFKFPADQGTPNSAKFSEKLTLFRRYFVSKIDFGVEGRKMGDSGICDQIGSNLISVKYG